MKTLLIFSVLFAKFCVCFKDEGQCDPKERFGLSVSSISNERILPREVNVVKNLIGLFPIHDTNCKTILRTKNYNGFQRAMAMMYAMEHVNSQVQQGDRKVALRGYIYDTCSNDISAMATLMDAVNEVKPAAGIIGASYSTVSISVSKVAQAHNLTMMSYASTSADLSNKKNHPLFARMVPSDDQQAQVVFDLLKYLNWTNIEVLTTRNSDYSKSLYEKFEHVTLEDPDVNHGVHICDVKEFVYSNKRSDARAMRRFLYDLIKSPIDGVVAFVTADTKRMMIPILADILAEIDRMSDKEKKRQGLTDISLPIIGTDSWDIGNLGNGRVEALFEDDGYVVIPDSTGAEELHFGLNFTEFFGNLVPIHDEHQDNGWMREVWTDAKNCSGSISCLKMPMDMSDFRVDSKTDFVIDSVLAYSDALERCVETEHETRCVAKSQEFFDKYLKTVNLKDEFGSAKIKMDCKGDRVGTYGIYKMRGSRARTGMRYGYQKVAIWESSDVTTSYSKDSVKVFGRNNMVALEPRAVECRPQCNNTEFEQEITTSLCCHECKPIPPHHYIKMSKSTIFKCEPGTWPNEEKDHCNNLTPESLNPSSPWSILSLTVAFMGLTVAICVIVFVFKHLDHEIIKSSSRELSVFIWLGVLVAHFNTLLVFLTRPSLFNCGLIRLTSTVCYTLMLSALFLKVKRIFIIFYGQFKQVTGVMGKPKFIGAKHQIMFACAFVLAQMLIVAVWSMIFKPEVKTIYAFNREVEVCHVIPVHLFIVQLYNLALCCTGTFYAFLTRNVPQNFNESKWINVTMYSVCFVWIIQAVVWALRVDVENEAKHVAYTPEQTWALSTMASSALGTIVLALLYGHRIIKILRLKRRERRGEEADPSQPQIIRMTSNGSEVIEEEQELT